MPALQLQVQVLKNRRVRPGKENTANCKSVATGGGERFDFLERAPETCALSLAFLVT